MPSALSSLKFVNERNWERGAKERDLGEAEVAASDGGDRGRRPRMLLDEHILATLDVNKGDGLRHTSHEENEDDVNQVDGLRFTKNDQAYHGPIMRSHARKIQQEVNSLFAQLNPNFSENFILPKCSTFVLLRFTPEDIITTPRRIGYVEDDKGYVEEESVHAQPVAVYANKKMVYAAKAQLPRLVRPSQSKDGLHAYMVGKRDKSNFQCIKPHLNIIFQEKVMAFLLKPVQEL
uniref:Uncharacterized protein n=1 Tax=Oryza glaberrima TaxID=4538 RepID=I1QT99_ORYGL